MKYEYAAYVVEELRNEAVSFHSDMRPHNSGLYYVVAMLRYKLGHELSYPTMMTAITPLIEHERLRILENNTSDLEKLREIADVTYQVWRGAIIAMGELTAAEEAIGPFEVKEVRSAKTGKIIGFVLKGARGEAHIDWYGVKVLNDNCQTPRSDDSSTASS